MIAAVSSVPSMIRKDLTLPVKMAEISMAVMGRPLEGRGVEVRGMN
jgi:hypothetical protein